MTYPISDVHGPYGKYMKKLEQIRSSDPTFAPSAMSRTGGRSRWGSRL